jgi:arginyl-tRNA synthetase
MSVPESVLTERFQAAFVRAFGPEFADADPIIRPSQFADLQCNAAMGLAKRLKRKPRDVAAEILAAVELEDVAESLEIAGPGFLNIRLRTDWIAAQAAQLPGQNLGIPTADEPLRAVIDYSAPNVAKEMHVGHLRTTIVGDALARTLEKLGHTVIRQNHIGDWGTPFGMLIEHLLDVGEDSPEAKLVETDPNAFYQAARVKFDDDPGFADRARSRVVTMQSGDHATLAIWSRLVDLSKEYFHRVYDLLDITLTDDDLAGESSYNPQLEIVAKDLEADGLARMSDGALCVFPEGFTGRDEQPLPLIIRKSGGGYGYATTDLAAVRHRVQDLEADRIVYVIGTAQQLHMQMIFETSREAGWLPDDVEATHVKIGSVLGEDGKILRTRSGASLRLMALLEEAVTAARTVIDELRPDLPEAERESIAHDIGIGGVKYADLSTAHDSDYTFDLDRMLALTGNTAPYLQYAVARIRSIGRKAEAQGVTAADAPLVQNDAERTLALELLQFGPVLAQSGLTYEPHRLCAYLFSLAQAFTTFYEASPILKEPDAAVRGGRLALARLTERVLVEGLDALGVHTPQQM